MGDKSGLSQRDNAVLNALFNPETPFAPGAAYSPVVVWSCSCLFVEIPAPQPEQDDETHSEEDLKIIAKQKEGIALAEAGKVEEAIALFTELITVSSCLKNPINLSLGTS